jgi:spermidine synthase
VDWGGRAIACGFVLLGVVLLWRLAGKHRLWALSFLPIATWLLLPGSWDYLKDHRAFSHQGELIYAGEDLNGGVTTVLDDRGNYRLYSNGFLQGGIGEVLGDQVRVGMIPMLYVREFGRALVIGVGTGQSAGVVHLFPFRAIELVDFSPRVVEAAKYHFSDLNMNVLADPRVKVHIADGRHYLLTHPGAFSLITLEASRLWFAGEGDLYTREFYQLCSARLGPSGVLQQWVPLFDLSQPDTLVVLRTLRAVFPYVTFYIGIESGMMVASRSPLTIDNARLKAIDLTPAQRETLVRIGLPHTSYLLGDCVLTPEGVDALLAREPGSKISTDLWPHLEYSNARFFMGNPSSRPLRKYLLTAQSFCLPAIVNADERALEEILTDAQMEHERRLRISPPH